jgi:histidine ammonia-lyase
MGMTAALKFRQIVENAERLLAIELLCAAQGLEYRAPLKPARRVGEAFVAVRSFVPALREDRVLSGDIEAMAAAVRTGKFDGWRN